MLICNHSIALFITGIRYDARCKFFGRFECDFLSLKPKISVLADFAGSILSCCQRITRFKQYAISLIANQQVLTH